jgi:hypothetical protein
MSLINQIINDLRYKLVDKNVINYTPEELLVYFNEGNRLLRRLVITHNPMLLAEFLEGIVEINTPTLILPNKAVKLIDARIGEVRLTTTTLANVGNLKQIGKPKTYLLQNLKTIRWIPIPDAAYQYSIIYVPETISLKLEDDSGWPSELEDYIAEYIVIRAGLRDEFDMSAETQFISLFRDEIIKLISDTSNETTLVRGYFDTSE